MKRQFTKYPSGYVRASLAWSEEYVKKPQGYDSKSFEEYTAEDWAYCIADELGLFSDDYNEILYNLKRRSADEWISDWASTLTNLRKDIYTAFWDFIQHS